MKLILFLVFAAATPVLLSGCASASSESEVMVDTSTRTKQHITGGLPGSQDASQLSDPFLSGN